MNVSEALASRRSVRGFRDTPIDPAVIRRIVEAAARAPSGGNVQPWHIDVVGGARLAELKAIMRTRIAEAPGGEATEYDIYPKALPVPLLKQAPKTGIKVPLRSPPNARSVLAAAP